MNRDPAHENDSDDEVIEQLLPPDELEKELSPTAKRVPLAEVPKVVADPDFSILAGIYAQRKTQAQAAFWVALPMGIAGVFLIFAGAFLDSVKAGVGGAVVEALTFFMIRFNREVNRGLDEAVEHLNFNRRIDKLFEKAEQIQERRARDKAIASLIDTLSKPLTARTSKPNNQP